MTDSFDTIEAYLKQANFKLDKMLFQLDSLIEQSASDMQISISDRCSPNDIHKIPEQLQELRNRYQILQGQKEEVSKVFNEKLNALEQKVSTL